MTIYDGVMIGLVLAGMIWGAIRGITWQLASIASLVLAYFFAHTVSGYIAPYVPESRSVRRAGSMLAAYVVVSGGVFFVAWMVRATLKKMKFEAYDRHLGMILGGLEGALLGIVGTLFVVSLAPAQPRADLLQPIGRMVARVMDAAGPILPAEIRKVWPPYWDPSPEPAAETQVAAPEVPARSVTIRSLRRVSSPRPRPRGTLPSRKGRGRRGQAEVERSGRRPMTKTNL